MGLSKRLYEVAGPTGQAYWDRQRYQMGLLPRVNPAARAAPANGVGAARAAVVFSVDFALAWAWRYARGVRAPDQLAQRKALQARANCGPLLDLFEHYRAPVTWATVGHLFLEECRPIRGRLHGEIHRLPYFQNEFWRYGGGDWFESDPCSDYIHAPEWYAPDLLRAILDSQVGHEIACHSFSHIDFRDSVCPAIVADSELARCQALARSWDLRLRSLVFPGNLPGNLASLQRHGFTAYRYHNGYELDIPRQDALGLWQIPGGISWEKPAGWPVKAWVGAIEMALDRAIGSGTLLSLWFHSSCDPVNVWEVFPAVLDAIHARGQDVCVTTMGGLVDTLALEARQGQAETLP